MNIGVSNEGESSRTIYSCIAGQAAKTPDCPAVIELDKDGAERTVTWEQLRRDTNKTAMYLRGLGVGKDSRVVIALPNGIPAVLTALAVWRLGACAFFLSSQLVPGEQRGLLDQIKPNLVASAWKCEGYKSISMTDKTIDALAPGGDELPDLVSCPGKAMATGGSTGVPKIILEHASLLYGEDDFTQWQRITGFGKDSSQLVCGSLHHSLFNNSFYIALAMGCTNVLLKRFDEALAVKAIEKYRINALVLVPTMMSRIIRCPELDKTDIGSVTSLLHAGAACPVWLKKDWINLIGAEHVHEFYSMSEKVGMTYIRGDAWLEHEGSVGRPVDAGLEILSDDGEKVPAGTVGNVYFIPNKPSVTNYLLADQKLSSAAGNAVSVGDLGYLDEDGYLYLVDRRSDMIVSGGKNVYAAEVENVLREYSKVRDIVVIGLADPTWGRRVHAIIEPDCPPEEFGIYEFTNFGFKHMSNSKLPKTIELVEALPRDESGKLRRKTLVDERDAASDAAEKFHFINVPNGHQLYAWRAAREKAKKAKEKNKEE